MIDADKGSATPAQQPLRNLRGKLDGFHSIHVNKQWRLIFR
jgi:plasmid maintenance system killer protein